MECMGGVPPRVALQMEPPQEPSCWQQRTAALSLISSLQVLLVPEEVPEEESQVSSVVAKAWRG